MVREGEAVFNRPVRIVLALALVWAGLSAGGLDAHASGGGMNAAFHRTWARTDRPVAEGQANRTWMWGPGPFSNVLFEEYDEGSEGGFRVVQYFDKTRMEITDTTADPVNPWYVTNGLLAKELITGQLQLGHNRFWQGPPAMVNVAGDLNDPNGPTYATFNALMGHQPLPLGWTIIQTVDRAGNVGANQSLASFGVTAATFVPETNHTVASVFWEFMNSAGPVYENGQHVEARLFENPFYATGFPLTEAYWTRIRVGGVQRWVLVQVFERRVLTYTPDNPEGWKVEAGNVGRHYYAWRYEHLSKQPAPLPNGYQPPPDPAWQCDPAYPDACIPSPPPDLRCAEIPYRRFQVLPPDPQGFDRDQDGVGCEG
uniref:Excalibur calcium-binding domain-containing protein n=1 Tax=Thermorudis sp. TaxID=1969470 RepID=A0A7C2WK81_9BACT